MRRSDCKYFCKTDFLGQDLYQSMLDPKNQRTGMKGLVISETGEVSESNDYVVRNYCLDQSPLHNILPKALSEVVNAIVPLLKDQGLKDPKVRHIYNIANTNSHEKSDSLGWHKDFNVEKNIRDPLKLWITFLILSNDKTNSKMIVSPTKEGPSLWNIGLDLTLETNQLIAHNFNLGHEYVKLDKNDLNIMYIRWYDNG